MIKLSELLHEGYRDPGIFKAVFLAGGPGSGKTYIAKGLFGIPEKVNVSQSGLKMVNSDKELKFLLNKYGFGTAFDEPADQDCQGQGSMCFHIQLAILHQSIQIAHMLHPSKLPKPAVNVLVDGNAPAWGAEVQREIDEVKRITASCSCSNRSPRPKQTRNTHKR